MIKSKNGLNLTDTLAGWEIIKKGNFDYGDHLEGYSDPDKKLPSSLIIHIALPGVNDPSTIDAEVHNKSVHIKALIHNFSIPLPYEVVVNDDYSAKWKPPLLTLEIKVKQEKKIRRPFLIHEEEEEIDDKNLETFNEPQQEVPPDVVYEAFKDPNSDEKPKVQTIQKMQYNMTTEDKVVTIVLYVPRAVESTLVVDDNYISIETKNGQLYQAEIKPPFPLKSDPVIKCNPVSTTLIFIETDEEEKPAENVDDKKKEEDMAIPEELPPMKNKFIYELEP
ncbi:hypothetical protein M9Y10_039093 [Tritrichomonas musculus]|uniref:PIH1D1/2/3 CS-like domain-containing protein n=1 Tax=Tritrichomonas musculus TaxID=1915356 RepID=A0ABR2KB05_9EUKA